MGKSTIGPIVGKYAENRQIYGLVTTYESWPLTVLVHITQKGILCCRKVESWFEAIELSRLLSSIIKDDGYWLCLWPEELCVEGAQICVGKVRLGQSFTCFGVRCI